MTISRNDLKKFSSLKRKSKRNELGLFVVEGKKICNELIKSDFEIERLFTTDNFKHEYPTAELISSKDADRLSNLKNQSNVIGIVKIPTYETPEKQEKITIYLEGINDPGNMGTILRSLDWFGYNNVYCSTSCVDAFNNKTVMASMGSVFRVKSHTISLNEICNKFSFNDIIGTTLDGENIYSFPFEKKSIIIIGNEANGISLDTSNKVNTTISIPKNGYAESLNVSIATSIILNEINRKTNF
jgi:RNA methyltransferase, TrmH family